MKADAKLAPHSNIYSQAVWPQSSFNYFKPISTQHILSISVEYYWFYDLSRSLIAYQTFGNGTVMPKSINSRNAFRVCSPSKDTTLIFLLAFFKPWREAEAVNRFLANRPQLATLTPLFPLMQ